MEYNCRCCGNDLTKEGHAVLCDFYTESELPMSPKQFRVGQTVRLTGKITKVFQGQGLHAIRFTDECDDLRFSDRVMSHAEIIAEPEPKCSKEFAEAIRHKYYNSGSTEEWKKWLEAHTE